MPEIRLVIRNPVGLHARPAALFVETSQRFQSEVRVIKNGVEANAKSILKILALGVSQNDEVTVRAEGPDAEAVLSALAELVEGNFGEG